MYTTSFSDAQLVTWFLQDLCEIDKKTYDMWTALHLACFEGNVRCVECLVGYGADVGALSARGSTPLHLVLNKKGMKPLSEWTKFLNEVEFLYAQVWAWLV